MKEAGSYTGSKPASEKIKEKMRLRFGKYFIVINKEGKIFRVKGLKSWAEKRNLNYKDLNAVARKKFNSSQNFIVFYKEEWILKSKNEKIKIIENFKIYNSFNTNKTKISHDKYKKEYLILYANGEFERVIGLTEFCNKNNYNEGNLWSTLNKTKYCKGLNLFNSLENLLIYYKENINFYKKNLTRTIKYIPQKTNICIKCNKNIPKKGRICQLCWNIIRRNKKNVNKNL